jgi:hypothetical protein
MPLAETVSRHRSLPGWGNCSKGYQSKRFQPRLEISVGYRLGVTMPVEDSDHYRPARRVLVHSHRSRPRRSLEQHFVTR